MKEVKATVCVCGLGGGGFGWEQEERYMTDVHASKIPICKRATRL